MKRTIRRNCFETNSSSMHSILVTKNDVHVKPEEFDYDETKENSSECLYMYHGKLSLWRIDDGYGRFPFQFLTSFKDKLKYAMCEILGYYYGDEPEFDDKYKELQDLVTEIVPGFKEFDIRTKDIEIYQDVDGNDLPHSELHYRWDHKEDESEYTYTDEDGQEKEAKLLDDVYYEVPAIGMIDHQSAGLLTGFLNVKHISLKEFLTNKKYAIIVTGDEYDDWPNMKNSGIINKDFILEEYTPADAHKVYLKWKQEESECEE